VRRILRLQDLYDRGSGQQPQLAVAIRIGVGSAAVKSLWFGTSAMSNVPWRFHNNITFGAFAAMATLARRTVSV
jgi:hypothetical protein